MDLGFTNMPGLLYANAGSFVGFWRCWNVGFSRWLAEYVGAPVGGAVAALLGSVVLRPLRHVGWAGAARRRLL